MPIRKQTITRIAIVLTAPGLRGVTISSTPWTSWITNVTASPVRNSASRAVAQRIWRSRTRDSSAAAMKASPRTATATEVGPILCPGTSANSDTASALVNAVRAADARMRWTCVLASVRVSRSAATEMATNNSPISAPATLAAARNRSWMSGGTTRRFFQGRRRPAADGVEFGERAGRQQQAGGGDVLAQVARDEVPGMRTIVGERRSSQARATCWGDAPRRAATPSSVADARAVKRARRTASRRSASSPGAPSTTRRPIRSWSGCCCGRDCRGASRTRRTGPRTTRRSARLRGRPARGRPR